MSQPTQPKIAIKQGEKGPSPAPSAPQISLIACPIFRTELEHILPLLGASPAIHYMDYRIHLDPHMMDEQLLLARNDPSSKSPGGPRLLLGRQCQATQDIGQLITSWGGQIPRAKNCIEILIGEKLSNSLQKDRTCLMTTAWIRMITQSIADGYWTRTDARLNLGWYDRILLLDSGLVPLDDEMLMEFYDLVQVEIIPYKIDLAHFRRVLQRLLGEQKGARYNYI